jgi:hypothetical protein
MSKQSIDNIHFQVFFRTLYKENTEILKDCTNQVLDAMCIAFNNYMNVRFIDKPEKLKEIISEIHPMKALLHEKDFFRKDTKGYDPVLVLHFCDFVEHEKNEYEKSLEK